MVEEIPEERQAEICQTKRGHFSMKTGGRKKFAFAKIKIFCHSS
jgi:hypothetical protein